ncbi:MAG: ABC transporter substrate binding protein [Blastocatellia bacterium]
MKPRRDLAKLLRLKLAGGTALLVCLILTLAPLVARAAETPSPKSVLVLYWYGKDFPSNVVFDRNFQKVLQAVPAGSVEYYPEYLESNRFQGESQSLRFRNDLREKYADRRIDVIIALSSTALNFLLKYRNDLFPGVPIVFYTITRPELSGQPAEPGLTGVVSDKVFRNTLDVALRLHPATKQAFVITGTPERDKRLEADVRGELQEFESRVALTYLSDLPLGEMLTQVKSASEPSIIFYVRDSQDEPGKTLSPADVLTLVAQSAKVPVYSLSGSLLGRGSVGGYAINSEACAIRAAEIALQIVNGARPQDIPVVEMPTAPMFDWRQLQRWGISEDQLPPGSDIRFKGVTFWEHYKRRIITAFAVCALQTLLITFLLVERRKRKRAKEELDQLNAELEQRVDDRTAELGAKTKELETFSYSVAHDLKAPLRGIDGYSRLLLEEHLERLDEEGRAFLHTIRDSTERMNQLIDDLLAYSRIERRALSVESIELRPFVETLVEERRPEMEERRINLTVKVNGGIVAADSEGLAQALRNYLDNAIKFTGDVPEPRIEVGAEETEKICRLWVRDNGAGFDMKYHDRIFEIFQRLHRLEEYPGTGVGLAIVRKAMERMGGRAWAESGVGQGATFYLEITKPPRSNEFIRYVT